MATSNLKGFFRAKGQFNRTKSHILGPKTCHLLDPIFHKDMANHLGILSLASIVAKS